MFKVKRFLGVAVVALIAPLLTLVADVGVTASPAAAAGSPCHGYVYDLSKNQATGKVKMTYWVYCSRSVDQIHVRAFLREGDRWAYTSGAADCHNTYVCSGTTSLTDPSGSQTYTARAVEGGDLADITYVHDGAHGLWSCGGLAGDDMTCTGAGKTF